MSTRLLVITEDFLKDQFVLKPIVEAMMQNIGKPQAKVIICPERLKGLGEALKWERLEHILLRFQGMVDIFLLCVDRDGQAGRKQALNRLESLAKTKLPATRLFLAENAHQEIEAWVLAGHDLLPGWSWTVIRAEPDVKELYYRPFAAHHGLLNEPEEGRGTLAQKADYGRICTRCPEVLELETRIQSWNPA